MCAMKTVPVIPVTFYRWGNGGLEKWIICDSSVWWPGSSLNRVINQWFLMFHPCYPTHRSICTGGSLALYGRMRKQTMVTSILVRNARALSQRGLKVVLLGCLLNLPFPPLTEDFSFCSINTLIKGKNNSEPKLSDLTSHGWVCLRSIEVWLSCSLEKIVSQTSIV